MMRKQGKYELAVISPMSVTVNARQTGLEQDARAERHPCSLALNVILSVHSYGQDLYRRGQENNRVKI